MPSLLSKLGIGGVRKSGMTMPTGYESDQLRIENKRRLAQALLERGLSPPSGMRSPFEALGTLAQAFAGKRLEKKAEGMESDLYSREISDYHRQRAALDAAIAGGMSNADIVKNFGGPENQLISEDVKPYASAFGKGLDTTASGMAERGLPSKPTDSVLKIPGQPGQPDTWQMNPLVAASRLYSNPAATITGSPVSSMTDPYFKSPAAGAPPSGLPPSAPAGAPQTSPASPAGAAPGLDLSVLSPIEQQMLGDYIRNKKAPNNNIPQGSPLNKPARPPDGMLPSGKPYWMINGQPSERPY